MEPGQTVERTLEFIRHALASAESGTGFYFAIESLADPAAPVLAGSIDIRLVDREDPRIGETGYLIGPEYRRQGVASRALRLLLGWAFGDPLRLERVQAMTHPSNDASAALLTSLGFRREGLLRAYRAAPPGPRQDVIVWALLRIDWTAT